MTPQEFRTLNLLPRVTNPTNPNYANITNDTQRLYNAGVFDKFRVITEILQVNMRLIIEARYHGSHVWCHIGYRSMEQLEEAQTLVAKLQLLNPEKHQ